MRVDVHVHVCVCMCVCEHMVYVHVLTVRYFWHDNLHVGVRVCA